MKSPHAPKTSISEIPVANERLYEETARMTQTRKQQVTEIVHFLGSFIAGTIKKGEMQGVMIPYFGKFMPKEKQVRAMQKVVMSNNNDTTKIFKALKRKK